MDVCGKRERERDRQKERGREKVRKSGKFEVRNRWAFK